MRILFSHRHSCFSPRKAKSGEGERRGLHRGTNSREESSLASREPADLIARLGREKRGEFILCDERTAKKRKPTGRRRREEPDMPKICKPRDTTIMKKPGRSSMLWKRYSSLEKRTKKSLILERRKKRRKMPGRNNTGKKKGGTHVKTSRGAGGQIKSFVGAEWESGLKGGEKKF